MEIEEFTAIVATFADRPADVDQDKGTIIVQVRDEIVEVALTKVAGDLTCREGEVDTPAYEWLVNRLARLDSLARRILDFVEEDKKLIPVSARVTDILSRRPEGDDVETEDVLESTLVLLDKQPAGFTSVFYLTSGAGEGKTSLINAMAREQARRYLEKRTTWILLPVSLSGKPFMRLDDLIVGTLSNRLRFPFLYYESVIELIKLGAIVLALDGFEEMFIETPGGEAVSSMGNLLSRLDSSGRLLIAARTAYYHHKGPETTKALFRSLGDRDVDFAEIALDRWDRDDFLCLAEKSGASDSTGLYETLSERLTPKHPLLTRAVLARGLIEEYVKQEEPSELLDRLVGAEGGAYFDEFVSALVAREAGSKWIDRTGDPAQPLLSVEEHHILLSHVAEEMWRSSTYSLPAEVLSLIAELVVGDALGHTPVVVRQAQERIVDHAMLRDSETSRRQLSFDHEDFRSYYLGRRLSDFLETCTDSDDLRALMRAGRLPDFAILSAVARLPADPNRIAETCHWLCSIAGSEARVSYWAENCGQIVFQLVLDYRGSQPIDIKGIYFADADLSGQALERTQFSECTFARLGLGNVTLKDVSLSECDTISCHLVGGETLAGLAMDETSLPRELAVLSEVSGGDDIERVVYDPAEIRWMLTGLGVTIPGLQKKELPKPYEDDAELKLAVRVLRQYRRATALNESVFKLKLGANAAAFFANVLPGLLEAGVLRLEPFKGAGSQRRFRLSIALSDIEKARTTSAGNFVRFLEILKRNGIA